MIPVVAPAEMRLIDEAAAEPVEELIERAGAAVARVAVEMLGGVYGRTVVVVAGPGNNGADGRAAAARLRERGVKVHVVDALDLPAALPAADLVIDAAFGSGFRDSWRLPDPADALILAVDVPTGLDGLTGRAGPGTHAADTTVTFAASRPGLVFGDGPDVAGDIVVADIGLDVGDCPMAIVEPSDVAAWLRPRARTVHKWADAVRVVAGSPGMTGSAHLAAAAALRTGSGMVAVSSPGIEAQIPVEAVGLRVPPFDWADAVLDDLHRYHALVIGPGLGREEFTIPAVVRTIAGAVVPIVIDGDGLYALSWNEQGDPGFLREREIATVLTPHDGEYGLLTGRRPDADRVGAARNLAERTGATVLLKGPTSIIATPGHRTWLVTNGTQRLATAGTGDVLAGIIGALLATGLGGSEAAAAGAWLHADAASRAAAGMVAGDLLSLIPLSIESIRVNRR